jgi:rare lipoprotein A
MLATLFPACDAKPRSDRDNEQTVKHTQAAGVADQPVKSMDGIATWYDVPPGSLAARRANENELTAAHDRLPKGTHVRVTNKKTGATVIVRITDDGVHEKGAIDLCKEAAEKVGLVSKGRAKVRMEILEPAAQ